MRPRTSNGFEYPFEHAARDRFVLERRGVRPLHDPWQHQGMIVDDEPDAEGRTARVATVFLTGAECPWRCVMCDLWRYTIFSETPEGAIPGQVASARQALRVQDPGVTQMKLYNAGSFFDPRAVPERDYYEVAAQLAGLERVIVESHPALVGPRVDRLLDALDLKSAPYAPPRLEVAMGLETAHPDALERLHKRFNLEQFARASEALRQREVALRVFLLISPPSVPHDEQDEWLLRSVEAAIACGASVISLVPTRPGNGAMETLADADLFRAPGLGDIERSTALALASARGRARIFVDLWDLERFATGVDDYEPRRARLHAMNLEQRVIGPPLAEVRIAQVRVAEVVAEAREAEAYVADVNVADVNVADAEMGDADSNESQVPETPVLGSLASEAAAAESDYAGTEPRDVNPREAFPRMFDLRSAKPAGARPRLADLRRVGSRVAEPQTVEQQTAEPRSVEPRSLETRTGESRTGDSPDDKGADPSDPSESIPS